jgi:hypothetical protein
MSPNGTILMSHDKDQNHSLVDIESNVCRNLFYGCKEGKRKRETK